MSWFNLLKRLFVQGTFLKPEKKEEKRRWAFGRVKIKRLGSCVASSAIEDRTLSEAEEEQNKHALTVALATAAAAEAAVAAAQAVAEVVRLTGTPPSVQCKREAQEFPVNELQSRNPQCMRQYEMEIQNLAAVRIQTAFRGYLARKALRALKGLVRFQAIIRGRAVRRQALMTLKCLQSIVNIQSQASSRRIQMLEETSNADENKQLQELEEKEIKMESNSQRRWDRSMLSKEEADALVLSKKEAFIKRVRIKEYSFRHLERKNFLKATQLEQNDVNGRWKEWLDQWVHSQVTKREELEHLDSIFSSEAGTKEELLTLNYFQQRYHTEGPPMSVPQRSFQHKKQNSVGDGNRLSCSSALPTYMAATASAKAKARSASSPKLRPGSLDTYTECNSPYKNKLSLISSINSEATCNSKIGKPVVVAQQRSPSSKALPVAVKSSRTLGDFSFDSECSLQKWDLRL